MGNAVRNMAAQQIGVINFDGARHTTKGLSGDQFAYATLQIPNPIPPEWVGKASRVAAYASVDGDPPAFKWMSIGPLVGEWGKPVGNPACVQGQSVQLIVSFGTPRPNATVVKGGETLYVNIQNRMPWMGGGSIETPGSCGPGKECDFTMDASIPG